MKKLQKGFTLIELLVVIAIIGILSSIVLASLSSARTKGEDAAITSTLSNMRVQAELYYSNQDPAGYGTVESVGGCDVITAGTMFSATGGTGNLSTLATDLVKKAGVAPATSCIASSTAWAVSAKLKSDSTKGTFCVDSTGQSKASTTATTAALAINATTGACI